MTLVDIGKWLWTTPVTDLLLWAFLGFGALLMLRVVAHYASQPLVVTRVAGHNVGRLLVALRGVAHYVRHWQTRV